MRLRMQASQTCVLLCVLGLTQSNAGDDKATSAPDRVVPEMAPLSTQSSMQFRMPLHNEIASNQMRCAVVSLQDTIYITGYTAQPTHPTRIHHLTMTACGDVDDSIRDGKIFACHEETHKRAHDCMDVAVFEEMSMPGMPGMPGMDKGQPMPGSIDLAQMPGLNMPSSEAPAVQFPQDTVLPVGPEARHKYVIISEHNMAPLKDDESGFNVKLRKPPIGKSLYFMITWDLTSQPQPEIRFIPPGLPTYTLTKEVSPEAPAGSKFQIFGMHLHFHSIGKKLIVEKRSPDGTITTVATRIGATGASPRFNPPVEMQGGDTIRASCIYDSSARTKPTPIGMAPSRDEMCQVFLLCSGDGSASIQWLGKTFPEPEGAVEPS